MDLSGGYIPSPSPPISRSHSPIPTSSSTSTVPVNPSPLSNDDDQAPAQPAGAGPAATLEGELTSVMAGLGSFWGKVRKQSVTAYHTAEKQMETARKDLTPLVSKARANLDSLSESTKAEFARLAEVSAAAGGGVGAGVVIGADGMPVIIDEPVQQRDTKGKGVDPGERGEEAESDDVNPGAAAAAFFAKLQSQVAANPNVQGLSKNLATLQHSVTTNLTTLPTSLQANLTTLQTRFDHLDLSDTVQQGEHWFADFSNEVQRLALDAVKVVPPEVEAGMRDERSRKREERLRKAEQVAVGRRDALVLRLRQDRQGFLVDPEEGEGRASFVAFLEGVKEQGGFEGESWLRRVAEEVEVGGEGLVDLVAGVVGTHAEQLTRDQFWSRYFWRVGQIDEDEERRRKVLEVTESNDDDFSWDMDEEEEDGEVATNAEPSPAPVPVSTAPPPATTTTSPSTTLPSTPRPSDPPAASEGEGEWGLSSPLPEPEPTTTTATTSPRASSDGAGSYDVVGRASGTPSELGGASNEGGVGAGEEEKVMKEGVGQKVAGKAAEEEEDEDSDWE